MILMKMLPIQKLVVKVKTWDPRKKLGSESFKYIDLSSVDKDRKVIDQNQVTTVAPSDAPSRARQLVDVGDVLVATVRPNLNGVAIIEDSEYSGATASTGYCVLRPNKELIEAKYLYYWVRTDQFVNEMVKLATGANYPAVSDKTVKNSLIPLPPLEEQKRIVAILDKADAIRRKRHQAIDLTDQLLRSAFLDMFGDPVTNPKGWEKVEFRKLISLTGGFAFKSTDYIESGIPLVRIGNANKGEFDISNLAYLPDNYLDKYKRYSLKPGDLLITLTGTVGKDDYGNIAIVSNSYKNWLLNQRVAKINIISDHAVSSYVKAILAYKAIKQRIIGVSRGVRQANIKNEDILSLEIPLPPVELQNKYADIEQCLRAISKRYNVTTGEHDALIASLTQKAFRGELSKQTRAA